MQIAVLGSGSKGNSILVTDDQKSQIVMIDCGLSYKETLKRCEDLGVNIEAITDVLITHEHSDHIKSMSKLVANISGNCYISRGTYSAFTEKLKSKPRFDENKIQIIANNSVIKFANFEAEAIAVPHDSAEPLQFIFSNKTKKIGILTDLGHISRNVADKYKNCQHLYLEFNHDKNLLFAGSYPDFLKQRVAGDYGHLNNTQAFNFLEYLHNICNIKNLFIAHISENNNSIALIEEKLATLEVKIPNIIFCKQNQILNWTKL